MGSKIIPTSILEKAYLNAENTDVDSLINYVLDKGIQTASDARTMVLYASKANDNDVGLMINVITMSGAVGAAIQVTATGSGEEGSAEVTYSLATGEDMLELVGGDNIYTWYIEGGEVSEEVELNIDATESGVSEVTIGDFTFQITEEQNEIFKDLVYVKNSYAFTATGTNCYVDPEEGSYEPGEGVEPLDIQVEANTGYIFDDEALIICEPDTAATWNREDWGVRVYDATADFNFTITCVTQGYPYTASCENGSISSESGVVISGESVELVVEPDEGYKFNGNVTVTNADHSVSGTTITISNANGEVTVEAVCEEIPPLDPSTFKLIYEKEGKFYGSTTGSVEGAIEFALYDSTGNELVLGNGPQASGECQLKNGYKVLYDGGARILKASKGIPASSDTTIKYKEVEE